MTLKEKIFFAEFPKMPQRNSIIRSYLLLKLLKKKRIIYFKNETAKNFAWIYFHG